MAHNEIDSTLDKNSREGKLYTINTATVFSALQEKWRSYDRAFLVQDVQNAILQTLHSQGIFRNLNLSEGERRDAINSAEKRYQLEATRIGASTDCFPFVDFFLVQKGGEQQIIDFDADCVVTFEDVAFPLFFFLQLSLTDVLEVQAFLDYQLHHNFSENEVELKAFLTRGLKKYAPLLLQSHLEEIAAYTTHSKEAEVQRLPGTTEYSRILAMHYIFQQLGMRPEMTNMSDAARLVQFITGIQTDAKQIGGTSVYKYLKDPLRSSDKTGKEVIKSLQLIRSLFEKLELTEITAMITRDLKSTS